MLTGRSPSKLLVSRSAGTITHADLISTYDSRFQLERGHETVPFRLTHNMQSFIGPQGMEGMVVCAITAAAQALQAEPGITSSIVALFFRWGFRVFDPKQILGRWVWVVRWMAG
jgi:transformation/transcription domain-associated protein